MEDQNNLNQNKDNNQDEEIKIIEIVENNIVIDEKVPENNLGKNNDINNNKKENEKIDKNKNEDNKEGNIIVINEVIDINKPNENDNKEEKVIKNDNIDKKENKEEKGLEEKLDMILKQIKEDKKELAELKKQNQSIIDNFNTQIKELKESHEKELNEIKQSYENKINEMKKDFAMKEDIKYFSKKREVDYVKDDLEALNSKFNNLEREYNSKMGFMESNMERIFKIEDENKKLGENKIVINHNEINDKNNININANINENINENNINKINHINNNKINFNYFDEKKNEIIKKDLNAHFDAKTYKDLKNILDEIFSEKNLKNNEISTKNLDNLKKIAEKLFKNKNAPLEYFNEYVNIIARERQNKVSHEQFKNLIQKKVLVFNSINQINEKLLSKLKKEQKKVNIKDFKIKEFRKEFQISEKDYPDEVLKKLYLDNNGNLNNLVFNLIIKK